MEINFLRSSSIRTTSVYRTAGATHKAMLNRLNNRDSYTRIENPMTLKEGMTSNAIDMPVISFGNEAYYKFAEAYDFNNTVSYKLTESEKEILDKLNNSNSYMQIGDIITLNDGTEINVADIQVIDVRSLGDLPTAKDNVIDFGSTAYYKFTNSQGKERIVFSNPHGYLCRPFSEKETTGMEFDKEAMRYIKFWNGLMDGQPLGSGYTQKEVHACMEEIGISVSFFTVKIGSKSAEIFYSASEHQPLHSKSSYDYRYLTMTSPEFSYEKSVFNELYPETEITIAGEKYILKEDYTLDIPYGTDIFDIQIPEHTHTNKALAAKKSLDIKI